MLYLVILSQNAVFLRSLLWLRVRSDSYCHFSHNDSKSIHSKALKLSYSFISIVVNKSNLTAYNFLKALDAKDWM